jgi:hypothetical protein
MAEVMPATAPVAAVARIAVTPAETIDQEKQTNRSEQQTKHIQLLLFERYRRQSGTGL